jgi:hypothetical protein
LFFSWLVLAWKPNFATIWACRQASLLLILSVNQQRIFDLYTGAGKGKQIALNAIAEKLSSEGIPPPSKTLQGKAWYSTSVKRILRNRAYIGEFSYSHNKVTITLPDLAIVSPEVWNAAQEQTQKNREMARRNNKKHDYLLRGKIKCACNLTMMGTPATATGKYNPQWKKTYLYYTCGRHRGDRHVHQCRESRLSVGETDAQVWEWVYGLISDDDALAKGIIEWQRRSAEQYEPKWTRLETLKVLIEKTERSMTRLAAAFRRAENDTEAESLEREHRVASKEYAVLVSERKRLESELAEQVLTPDREATIRLIAKTIRSRIGAANFEQKRDALNLLNFTAQLGYNGQRGLWCTCALTMDAKFLVFDSPISAVRCG